MIAAPSRFPSPLASFVMPVLDPGIHAVTSQRVEAPVADVLLRVKLRLSCAMLHDASNPMGADEGAMRSRHIRREPCAKLHSLLRRRRSCCSPELSVPRQPPEPELWASAPRRKTFRPSKRPAAERQARYAGSDGHGCAGRSGAAGVPVAGGKTAAAGLKLRGRPVAASSLISGGDKEKNILRTENKTCTVFSAQLAPRPRPKPKRRLNGPPGLGASRAPEFATQSFLVK
jgi:hypothetical protein